MPPFPLSLTAPRDLSRLQHPRSLSSQLPWLSQMMHAAAACPIFGFRHTHNQLQPLAWLSIRPFLSAPQLAMWLRDTTSNSRRKLSNRSRRRLLCFVQLGVVASRLCFFSDTNVQRSWRWVFDFFKIIIRRCLSVRGVNTSSGTPANSFELKLGDIIAILPAHNI